VLRPEDSTQDWRVSVCVDPVWVPDQLCLLASYDPVLRGGHPSLAHVAHTGGPTLVSTAGVKTEGTANRRL
jgi:hypothetical protein